MINVISDEIKHIINYEDKVKKIQRLIIKNESEGLNGKQNFTSLLLIFLSIEEETQFLW